MFAMFTMSFTPFATRMMKINIRGASLTVLFGSKSLHCTSAQSGHGLFYVPRGTLGCHVVVLIRLRKLIWVCIGRSNDFYMLRSIDFS